MSVPVANAATTSATTSAGTSAAESPATVTVNTRAALATVPDTGVGANHAVWDSQLGTDTVADLLKDAGVRMMRYPGGSYSDIYHWKDNTAPGGYVAPGTDFDTFMGGVRRAGAQPIIIANYGTGTAQEAADWVKYANVTKGYGVKYWEIGNELYGNGHYGANWEADDHVDKGPAEYARNVVAYADAMKAVDPTVKIGAVLTAPANWPDALVGSGDQGNWNQVVLAAAASKIDFVILHWYPSATSPAEVLTRPGQIDDMIYLVRRQIAAYAGSRAADIGIAMTETNSGLGTTTQPGALFAADAYTTLLENGVFNVDWWDVHNGPGTVSTIAGQTDYGDWGMLSSGTCAASGECEPALNTPFAPYHGIKMVSTFARPGDQLVRAASSEPLVSAHAARRPNGDLAVLLVNRDPDNPHPVTLDYSGFAPASGAPTVYSYTNGAASVTSASTGTATAQTLPPYSLTTLVLHPAAATTGAPGIPGGLSASAVTDTSATINWTAADPGAKPIVKYEVYRQNGATGDQFGETPGTSFTVHNLIPGTRYTVNIVARDSGGGVSWASPPLTFTTGSPAQSTCSVRFTDTNDWGNGYIGSVDITNNGSTAIDGWTLRFSWPTDLQTVGSGWNGTWTQTGRSVTVTGLPGSRLDPSGGTTNVGFVGNYSGPNILPGSFTLNGTVCTVL
ncbi:cellulose binding domain-containing protein [Microbispora sp. RL4-1S]|uniref:Cellulose binding domain-containing protein n=2 Tax=Microbispora oryzae TaxID=2806554 RepID=A0A940WPR5_9ACTN|nr:cellulose binding domain-containing protein [Microbispora oryzae]